jgi:hypothetical protein
MTQRSSLIEAWAKLHVALSLQAADDKAIAARQQPEYAAKIRKLVTEAYEVLDQAAVRMKLKPAPKNWNKHD